MEDKQPQQSGVDAQAEAGGQLRIQKVYVKDLSFETPNTPAIFLEQMQTQPKVEFQIGSKNSAVAENLYEIVLNVTVTLKIEEKTAFLVEVQQAGLFSLSDFSQEQLPYILNAYCPNILFPFARETVSDLVTRGGFPQLLLEPMNFDAFYTQQLQEAQKRAQQSQGAPETTQ